MTRFAIRTFTSVGVRHVGKMVLMAIPMLLAGLINGCCLADRLGLEPVPPPRPAGECVQCRYRVAERGRVCESCRQVERIRNENRDCP